METTSIQKYIHTTPRKLRLVVDMVRKMQPEAAVQVLEFTPKLAAKDMSKAIKTALGDANMRGLNGQTIAFKSIEINEGPKMKRYRVGTAGRGRGRPYAKKISHIKIVLTDNLKPKSQITNIKTKTERSKQTEVVKPKRTKSVQKK